MVTIEALSTAKSKDREKCALYLIAVNKLKVIRNIDEKTNTE
jgi:hypothetical protein